MKSIALLGFAIAMSPALAAAQQSPTLTTDAAATTLPRPNFAAMQQMHTQMESIHKQARLQMLSSLTPAHRTMLANIVGQLAISANPDRDAAARALDSALTQSEQRNILGIESNARTASRNLMETARTQFEATLTPEQRTEMQTRMQAHQDRSGGVRQGFNAARGERTPDAGRTLLELAIGGGHEGGSYGHGRTAARWTASAVGRGERAEAASMQEAADALYQRAQRLAGVYREQNIVRILALLEEAASFEHADALYDLGTWHHHGIGIARNDTRAADFWRRAADRGHLDARFQLAMAYERGMGVEIDAARAFALYAACADSGHVNARYEVGRCRYYGIGTFVDRVAAESDFLTARQYGNAEAECDAGEDDGPRRMPPPAPAW